MMNESNAVRFKHRKGVRYIDGALDMPGVWRD